MNRMFLPDADTTELIRFLITIIKPLRDHDRRTEQQWPEGYCAETTALITRNVAAAARGFKAQCGGLVNPCSRRGISNHAWVKKDGINFDFTGQSTTGLAGLALNIDGFEVIVGSDEDFRQAGYLFYPPEQCKDAIDDGELLNTEHEIK